MKKIFTKWRINVMGNYFQKEIECASADQIRAWQSERLVKQVKNIYDNVPYYRTRMQNKGKQSWYPVRTSAAF